ncbi:SusC/RagA family TonB-linked outer membrane protein [Chitinophagaceae bacterium LB-8]|uniref:SusC/RagA family TonB-linked outer membrane protein n=1 Tax=Paraflavisolibacter caeni TaxID=2982496 RepID=A0A9X2XVA3_9BACT|nr:SusC/RagA family TonB-linked outer membrane protein [Paraflavisolibacter caeni]MCU7549791.1 SusC/RagA family TonB-linked outer membrane protein [Paraflavisolibacter caeni]
MKLSVFLILLTGFQCIAANSNGQEKISLNLRNVPLDQALKNVREQSGYNFFYKSELVAGVKVNAQVKEQSLEQTIDVLLKSTGLGYQRTGDHLISIFQLETNRVAFSWVLNGKVLTKTNQPVVGASILVMGTKRGASTGNDGEFMIEVDSERDSILVTAVGFKSKTLLAGSSRNIIITLEEDLEKQKMNEVVVTAFGQKQIKEAVTGSVTTIKPGELKIPSSNLTNALAGQLAGIIGYQPGGQPGYDNAQFFIRGVTTFGYNNSPLILIDNIESSTTDLARLQVDDIESFSLLKDAGATSLYGSRGANGVLLVTTKKGKEGRPNLTFRIENSVSSPTSRIELADPITYMKLYNEAIVTRDPFANPKYDQNKLVFTQQTVNNEPGANPYMYPANDWLNQLFKKHTNNQRANLNISGGGGVARYYVSGSYNVDNGLLKVSPVNNFNNNVKLQNYQLRSNIDISLTKTTSLSLLLGGIFDEYNGPITTDPSGATDMYNLAMHTDPVLFPAYYAPDSANMYTKHVLFGNIIDLPKNPYAELLKGYSEFTRSTVNVQLNGSQKLDFITKGLKFSGLFSTQRYSYYSLSRQYLPFYYNILPTNYDPKTGGYNLTWINSEVGKATEYLNFTRGNTVVSSQVYFQGILNWDRTFGLHTLGSSLVAARQQQLKSDQAAAGDALTNSLAYRNLNYSGRASYTYDRRYTMEFSFGYNGSERFSENNRFGFFPTVGGAWTVSNEKFWESSGFSKVINRLKFRGSYGLVGNDNIAATRFFYLASVNLNGNSGSSFGVNNGYARPGVTIANYPNPEVTWETSTQTNLATEFTLLNDLKVVAELYTQKREKIYQNRLNIANMGLEAGVGANIGEAFSKGLDLQMDYSKNITPEIMIAGRGNLTVTQSKYGFYEEPEYPGQPWRKITGSYINQRMGYIAERLFVDDEEVKNSPYQFPNTMGGDIKYRDINNDGVINTIDMVPIGNPTTPQITYGFGLSSRIKQFDIACFFQGNAKTSLFIDPNAVSPFIAATANQPTQLLKEFADNHWSEDNRNIYALYPRMGITPTAILNNTVSSTWWMREGSFMRLKSVELGYSLKQGTLSRLRINNCRFYLSGLNLLLFSKFKSWDVEQGGNAFAYPIQKVFNGGIQISIK